MLVTLFPAHVRDLNALTNLPSSHHFCQTQYLLCVPRGAALSWPLTAHHYWSRRALWEVTLAHRVLGPTAFPPLGLICCIVCWQGRGVHLPCVIMSHSVTTSAGPSAVQSFYWKSTSISTQSSLSLHLQFATITVGRGQSRVNILRSTIPSFHTRVCLAPSYFRMGSVLRGHSVHI